MGSYMKKVSSRLTAHWNCTLGQCDLTNYNLGIFVVDKPQLGGVSKKTGASFLWGQRSAMVRRNFRGEVKNQENH